MIHFVNLRDCNGESIRSLKRFSSIDFFGYNSKNMKVIVYNDLTCANMPAGYGPILPVPVPPESFYYSPVPNLLKVNSVIMSTTLSKKIQNASHGTKRYTSTLQRKEKDKTKQTHIISHFSNSILLLGKIGG